MLYTAYVSPMRRPRKEAQRFLTFHEKEPKVKKPKKSEPPWPLLTFLVSVLRLIWEILRNGWN